MNKFVSTRIAVFTITIYSAVVGYYLLAEIKDYSLLVDRIDKEITEMTSRK